MGDPSASVTTTPVSIPMDVDDPTAAAEVFQGPRNQSIEQGNRFNPQEKENPPPPPVPKEFLPVISNIRSLAGADPRNNGKSIEEMMEFALEHPHETRSDVTFLVGPEEEEISAHKLFLGLISPVFNHVFNNPQLKDVKTHMNFLLPNVSPTSFRFLLIYIYNRKVGDMDLNEAIGLLQLAYRFNIPDLAAKCMAQFRTGLNYKNAVEILRKSWESPEPRLRQFALAEIASNANEVFQTTEFLKLDLEQLSAVLESNLNLPEYSVFIAAKRWAEEAIRSKSPTEDVNITGQDIRKQLGKALFLIRFPLMSGREYTYVRETGILIGEEVLEIYESMIRLQSSEKCNESTLLFSSEPRRLKKTETKILVVAQDTLSTNSHNDAVKTELLTMDRIEESDGERVEKRARLKSGESESATSESVNTQFVREVPLQNTLSPVSHAAETYRDVKPFEDEVFTDSDTEEESLLKKETENEPEEGDSSSLSESNNGNQEMNESNAESLSSLLANNRISSSSHGNILTDEQNDYEQRNRDSGNNLTNLYNKLKGILETEGSDSIKIIQENHPPVVIDTASNLLHLDLPSLTEYNVHFMTKNRKITSFKKWLADYNISPLIIFRNFDQIEDLVDFFQVIPPGQPRQEIRTTININGVTVLKVDYQQSSLTLSRINSSIKWIMESLYKSKLFFREIHIEECRTSLDLLPFETLEVLTLRKVLGCEKGRVEFLQKCKNLREFSCTAMSTYSWRETIDFGLHLGLLSPQGTKLRRIALAKAKIHCSNPFKKLDNQIEELYLDNCIWSSEFIDAFPFIFPNLKKLKIFRNTSLKLLLNALKIESLEWVGVWKLSWKNSGQKKGRGKPRGRKDLQEPSLIVQITKVLEEAGFDSPWIKNTRQAKTFILEREVNQCENSTGPNIPGSSKNLNGNGNPNQLNRTWRGTKIRNKFDEFTRLDFEQFGWSMFYENFDLFYKLNE